MGEMVEISKDEFSRLKALETIGTMRQPPPIQGNTGPDVTEIVISDLIKRREIGTLKYGVPLRVLNGRNALVDAYQEAIDLALYLRQKLAETPPPLRIDFDAIFQTVWLRWKDSKVPTSGCNMARIFFDAGAEAQRTGEVR